MAGLMARWRDFDLPVYHGGHDSRFTLEVATNWKLAVENYCESYHLPWVHPGLNSYSKLEDHYHIEAPGAFSGQGTMVYRQITNEHGETFPDFDDVGAKWNEQAEYIAAYPNVLDGGAPRPRLRHHPGAQGPGTHGRACASLLCGAAATRGCACATPSSGRRCSRRISSWSRACSAAGMRAASMAGGSRR